jgi:hypothetical protein
VAGRYRYGLEKIRSRLQGTAYGNRSPDGESTEDMGPAPSLCGG